MKKMRAFGWFWYDFIIGDDWRLAAGVVAGLGLTAGVVHVAQAPGWWLLPLIVLAMLAISVQAGTKSTGPAPDNAESDTV